MNTNTLISKNFSELQEGLAEELFGSQEPEPSLLVREDLKKLLGPLVPALLHDCCGALDVTKIKAKDFAEFRDFLKTQAALNDQKSFRDPFASLLEDENFEPLLRLLFQEIDAKQFVSLPMVEAEALIREFQGRLIEIDANAFAQSHINSPKGRDFLRQVLSDRSHFSLEQRADLVKAIGRWDDEANPQEDANYGYLISQRLSLWNYFNWGVAEDEVETATTLAISALDQADENEKLADTAPMIHGALSLDAAKLERMEKIAKSLSLDPRSEVRARLAELWLVAANTHRLSEGLDGKAYGLNRYVMERTESFLKQAESLNSDEGLRSFNEELQDFLSGPLKQDGESSAFAWAKHQIAGGGLDDLFAEQSSETRGPFEALNKLSDEWKHALDCDETILQGPTQSSLDDPKLQEATSRLIQGLQKTKRELWYGYQQHRAISRLASNVANIASTGDIADILEANAVLDQCIARLAEAKDASAVEREVEFLYGHLKEDGLLNQAFAAAEMEGVEQLLGLAQTTAVIAATTYVTRGANVAAIGSIAVVRGAGAANYLRSIIVGFQGLRATARVAEAVETVAVSDRIAKGFAWGSYISTAENVVAASSDEVRPGQEKLGDWFKDALTTGAAMSFTGALPVSHAAEGALPRQMLARYTQGGIRGVGRLGLDVATEIAEESLDQYGRQALDGKTQALSFAQLEEISKLSSLGGFTKVGAVAEAIRGKTSSSTPRAAVEARPETPKPRPSRILSNPVFSPMWVLMGVDGLGGLSIKEETKPTSITASLIERRAQLFDRLVQSALPGQEVELVSYVLEHSIEDGIRLADRLRLTPLQWEAAIWNEAFAFKHPDVCRIMIETIKSRGSIKLTAKSFLEALQSAVDSADPELMSHQGFQGRTKPPSDLAAEIDAFYLDAFLTRKPIKPAASRSRIDHGTESPGQRTAHRYLEDLASVFERRFYTGPIRRLLSDHAEDPLFEDSTVTEEQLGKFCVRKGLNSQEIAAQLNSARVVAFRPLHQLKQNAVKQALIAELNAETPGMRVELDFESDRYRLEIEEDISLEETRDPVKERLAVLENRALDILEWLLENGAEEAKVARGLVGIDSDRAWELRERLLEKGADVNYVAEGLIGMDSDRAWALRKRLLEAGASLESVSLGIAGLDSERAWAMRERWLKEGVSSKIITRSIDGLDSEKAWNWRAQWRSDPSLKPYIASSLTGMDSERAWEMRDLMRKDGVSVRDFISGLASLDSDRAWEMRDLMRKEGLIHDLNSMLSAQDQRYVNLRGLVFSLAGLDSSRSWEMREWLLKTGLPSNLVLQSLAGLDSNRAWEMRERFPDGRVNPFVRVSSISGNHTTHVWRLRPEWQPAKKIQSSVNARLAAFENRILDEMEYLLDQEVVPKELIASNLAGLDSKRAWELRERLLNEGVSTGKVAMSLAGLDSDQAWNMRQRLLKEGAGKHKHEVFEGLAGLDSDRAWALRHELMAGGLNQDSLAKGLAGLDSDQAWEIRERLLKEELYQVPVAAGLAGLDSERAWEMRERLMEEKAHQGFVAQGLAGLDSERAWKIRNRALLQDPNMVALGLAGLDSERAWKIREGLLGDRTQHYWVLAGLAGVDSKRAWELRTRLKGTHWIAPSLAGDYVSFVWRLRPEWQSVKKVQSSVKERFARFENRVLDTMEQFLKTGPYTDLVVSHLAGLDSERAWELRERLLEAGAYKGSVAMGLAGLDSARAWEMRQRLMKERADSILVVQGITGLDSEQAWEMREQLLEKVTHEGMVAQSLAGLDSERAWKMREHLLNRGASKDWVALGLAALDSEPAWEMRERLLKERADKGSVAIGLAGLESERAWTMRERLLKEGAKKGLVAQGLAGLDSERAWELRERLLKEGADVNLVARGLAGLNSERAWNMRLSLEKQKSAAEGMMITSLAGDNIDFTWRLRPDLQGPAEAENEGLQLLNLVHRPSLAEIQKYFDDRSPAKAKKSEKEALPPHAAKILSDHSQMDRKTALSLLRTNPAVPDRAAGELARQLILRILPRLAPSPPSLGSLIKDRILGRDPTKIGPLSEAFKEQSNMLLQGAGFQQISDKRPLLQSRQAIDAFLVSGVYGRFNANTGNWQKTYFPARHESSGPARENTFTLLDVKNAGRISLPLPHDGQLISERVRGFTAQGQEIPLKPIVSSLGEAAVDIPGEVVKVLYSIEQPLVPEPMANVEDRDFSAFIRGLDKEARRDLTTHLARLPIDLSAELRSPQFLALSPKEKVQRIEAMVREIAWYDLHNEEVSGQKVGKPPEEQLMIAEQRMKALRDKDPSIPHHKRFAGVCADFSLLTITLLREAGIPAGLLEGLNLKGQEAQVRNHHVTAFVPWPDGKGGVRIVPVDGTPSRLHAAQPSSRPSLTEAETQAQQESAAQAAASEAAIANMLKEAKAESVESVQKLKNGELEHALNVILQHEVKRSHVRAIRRVLEAYWYHGLDRRPMDESELSKYLFGQIFHERTTTPEKDRLEPAGALMMTTVREFLGKFQRGQPAKSAQEALKVLEHVTAIARPGLSEVELRALTAVIAYLKAESMQGGLRPTFPTPDLTQPDWASVPPRDLPQRILEWGYAAHRHAAKKHQATFQKLTELSSALEKGNSLSPEDRKYLKDLAKAIREELRSFGREQDAIYSAVGNPISTQTELALHDVAYRAAIWRELDSGIDKLLRGDFFDDEFKLRFRQSNERILYRNFKEGIVLAGEEAAANLSIDFSDDAVQLLMSATFIRETIESERFNEILANLFSNSARYRANDPATVLVHPIRLADGSLEISISDNGIGLLPENLPKLGQPGFREMRKAVEDSHGFGVAAVIQNLRELNWGPLWVRSSPGRGLQFRFVIPASEIYWLQSSEIKPPSIAKRDYHAEGFVIPEASRDLMEESKLHAFAAPALLGADFMLHGQLTLTGALITGLATLASSGILSGIFSRGSKWVEGRFRKEVSETQTISAPEKKSSPYREDLKGSVRLTLRGAELVTQLKNGGVAQRMEATRILADLKELGAIEALRNMLNDETEDQLCRISAIQALGKLHALEAIDDLNILLRNKKERDFVLRIQAAVALHQIGSPEGILGLRSMMSDKEEEYWARFEAIQVLVKLNAGGAIDDLHDDLRKILKKRMENYEMRMSAAKALFNTGDRQVLDDLRLIIADTNQGYDAKQSARMRKMATQFIADVEPDKEIGPEPGLPK